MALLKLLLNGEVCSGERLGEALGISRAAVWKHLRQLRDFGLVLETLRGSGYRLQNPLQLLDKRYLETHIDPGLPINIKVESSIASTSQFLYQALSSGAERGPTALFAEHQTQGRGRRGRVWQSPFGSNLYFSVAWPYSQGVNSLEGVSLAIGVAICRALNGLGIAGVGLKWPNDVLFDQKKLAGILVEVGGDVSGECFIVVGIGLNVNMPQAVVIDQAWIDLRTLSQGRLWDRNQIAVKLLNELLPMLNAYSERGFEHYRQAWHSFHAYQNQPVKVIVGQQQIRGKCLGVDPSGSLRLDTGGGERVFSGGELSLRLD